MTTERQAADVTGLGSFRSVLELPGSARLFASALVGRMPQGMAPLAILLLVRESTHSYAAAGLAVGAFAFATAAMAPLQGRLIDRFGRVRVLAPSATAQGLVLVGLAVLARAHASPAVLVLLAGVAGALLPPIAAAVRALLREVFPDPLLRDRAYALESVVQELIWISGPVLVALLIEATSARAGLLIVAGVCIAGAVTFVRSPLARTRARAVSTGKRTAALSSSELRRLLAPVALTGIGLGATEVGLPSLALHAGSRWATGLLLALWSVGSMAGGLWYGARTWHSPLASRYRNLLLIAALLAAPLIVARSVTAGAFCSLLAGLTTAPMFACQYALVSRVVTPGSENEAFTWIASALIGGIAAGSAAAGAVIGAAGVSGPFALGCLATALAALPATRLRPRVQAAA